MVWAVCQGIALGIARNKSELKSASVLFSLLAVVGVFMMLITPLLIVGNELTMTGCGAAVWLGSFGFSLTYGSLFAKLFRLYKIFTSRSLIVPKLSNLKLFLIVLVFLVIDFVLLLIYNVLSPPEPVPYSILIPSKEDLVTGHRDLTWTMCTFHDSPVLYLLLTAKLVMALSGGGMSFLIRQVDRRFSATSALGGSFYNMFLTVMIAVVLVLFFKSTTDPTQMLFIPVFCGIWIIFITLVALTLDSNVLLACKDLSRPLRRLMNPKISKEKEPRKVSKVSDEITPENVRRSHSSTLFVVNREMFPSKYEAFDPQLLEKILEELNFQRTAVRRALVTSSSPGQSVQLAELDRHRTSTQLDLTPNKLSKNKSAIAEEQSPRAQPDAATGPLKVVVDAPEVVEVPQNVIVEVPLSKEDVSE
jgi:hypothetical protein